MRERGRERDKKRERRSKLNAIIIINVPAKTMTNSLRNSSRDGPNWNDWILSLYVHKERAASFTPLPVTKWLLEDL